MEREKEKEKMGSTMEEGTLAPQKPTKQKAQI